MLLSRPLGVLLGLLPLLLHLTVATRLQGTFETDDFFLFLDKFGFQRSEKHTLSSFGYIFGNITSKDHFHAPITLAVLDRFQFLEYFYNRTLPGHDHACQMMMSKVERFAYSSQCNPQGNGDYLRRVPCPEGKLCEDEQDSPQNVVPKNQLTFVIRDLKQPRFWYISLVACYRNLTDCQWHYYDWRRMNHTRPPRLQYDLQLVNGNPNKVQESSHLFGSGFSPLEYHFSFDQQYILEMYLIFFSIYLILVPLQISAMRLQKHPVTRLFTASLILEFVSLGFMLGHLVPFAFNGVGSPDLSVAGSIFDIFSRTSFMLILLLLAKGWAVTRLEISGFDWIILMSIWVPYCIFHIFLFVWNQVEVDAISEIDEYETWPGLLVLACRSLMMMWFLWELRNTMRYEHSTKKLEFLLHFGASSLVWFIYLPIVALVALQISPLWRYKLILGITNSADCLGYCVMMGLLWPNRAGQYLLLAAPNYAGMDELDEFNEAPHVVHRELFVPMPADFNDNDDADSETLVLSTDDLLVNSHHNADFDRSGRNLA